MAEIIGLGLSHYPPLSGTDEDMAGILRRSLKDPDVPPEAGDPANWPELMREEWGSDDGASGAARHREGMLRGLRKVRQALDDFNPDLVVIWGDDQYENFREDIVPPYCVLAYEDMDVYPWQDVHESGMLSGKANAWNEPADTRRRVRCHRDAGRHIAEQLILSGFDMAYAYQPLHHPGLSHAFLNAVLYLDYDRLGFDYPIVPVQINCYGSYVIAHKGFMSSLADRAAQLDPPAPMPSRCFDLGANIARICRDSEYRVALVASSSWSHAFLTDKTYRLFPDNEFDRKMYEHLTQGRLREFRELTPEQLTDSGNPELLNWCALLGAMDYLGHQPVYSDFVETYVYNSNKVSAVFQG